MTWCLTSNTTSNRPSPAGGERPFHRGPNSAGYPCKRGGSSRNQPIVQSAPNTNHEHCTFKSHPKPGNWSVMYHLSLTERIAMNRMKLLIAGMVYAVVAGALIGWNLPSAAEAGPVCAYPPCNPELLGNCTPELCCRTETCQSYPIKRMWVGRHYDTCYPSQKCIISVICASSCEDTQGK